MFAMYAAGTPQSPAQWAAAREAEGWDGIAVSDHVWVKDVACPHLWVALGAAAMATSRVQLTSSFANNLVRSPVEFAQASLMVQEVSGGRFEAGLGAGWLAPEMASLGIGFEDGATRRARYGEALAIVCALFRERHCHFDGAHYHVHVPAVGPNVAAPPLVAAAGNRRTVEAVAPYADGIEVKLPGFASGGRGIDFEMLRSVAPDMIAAAARQVREFSKAQVGLTIVVAVGEGRLVRRAREVLGTSWYGRFAGQAATVAAAVRDLGSLGIERLQVGVLGSDADHALAAALFEQGPLPAPAVVPSPLREHKRTGH